MKRIKKFSLFDNLETNTNMKHSINEDKNWLLSKKEDIIDCSYDLTDLPYDFASHMNLSIPDLLDVVGYQINWSGKINSDLLLGVFRDCFIGKLDGNKLIITSQNTEGRSKSKDREVKVNKLIDEILPNLESVVLKLKGFVFNDTKYKVNFKIILEGSFGYANTGSAEVIIILGFLPVK